MNNANDLTPDNIPIFQINDKVRRKDIDNEPWGGLCLITGVQWDDQTEEYMYRYFDTSVKNPSMKIAPEDSFTLVERGGKASLSYQELDTIVDEFVKLAKEKGPKWKKQPKGWEHSKSVKKYWKSLTEGSEHPFTECVEKMEKHMKNPEGFCAKTKDVAKGTTKWRGKGKKKAKKKSKK